MTDSVVTPLRLRGRARYTDAAALNDIHTLLTTASGDADRALLGDVATILARSGRPMVRVRDIEANVSESATGWPVARVTAEDTTVTVLQDPTRPGLRVEITTSTAAERDLLMVTLDDRCLHHPHPPSGHAA